MIINTPWSKRVTRKCPDGTLKTYYKKVDDAFPLAIKDYNAKFNADIDAQKQATAKIGGEYSTKIQSLLFSISEQNESLMLMARNAYIYFQSDPCTGSPFLEKELKNHYCPTKI
jgi:hypothetical protein